MFTLRRSRRRALTEPPQIEALNLFNLITRISICILKQQHLHYMKRNEIKWSLDICYLASDKEIHIDIAVLGRYSGIVTLISSTVRRSSDEA